MQATHLLQVNAVKLAYHIRAEILANGLVSKDCSWGNT